MTLRFSSLNVRQQHVNVAIAAKTTFVGRFAHVKRGRVTVVCPLDRAVEGG